MKNYYYLFHKIDWDYLEERLLRYTKGLKNILIVYIKERMTATNLKQFLIKENIPHYLIWYYLKKELNNPLVKKTMTRLKKYIQKKIVIHQNHRHILKKTKMGVMMTFN